MPLFCVVQIPTMSFDDFQQIFQSLSKPSCSDLRQSAILVIERPCNNEISACVYTVKFNHRYQNNWYKYTGADFNVVLAAHDIFTYVYWCHLTWYLTKNS